MENAENAMTLGAEYVQKQRARAERIHEARLSFWINTILPYMSSQFFSSLVLPADPSMAIHQDFGLPPQGPMQWRTFKFDGQPISVNFAFKTSPYSVDANGVYSSCIDVSFNSVMHRIVAIDLTPVQSYKIHETVTQLGWTLLVNDDRSVFRFIQTTLLNAVGYAPRQEREWLIEGFAPWPFYV